MLGHFLKGFFTAALCMSIALAFKIPLDHWRTLTAHDWVIGLGIIFVASIAVGTLTAVCWLISPRDRFGRRRSIADPTDIIPFI